MSGQSAGSALKLRENKKYVLTFRKDASCYDYLTSIILR